MGTPPPHGTVTFLFTDVEGSTRQWEESPEAMRAALAAHDRILCSVIEEHGGYVFSTAGDAFSAAFWTPQEALAAAVEAQRQLTALSWPEPVVLRVRMGINTGTADERGGDYFGTAVNRAARLMAAGHGGQVLVSAATEVLMIGSLPEGVELVSLGKHRLRDLLAPEVVWQVVAHGVTGELEALRTPDDVPGNLPVAMSSCLGREGDVARVREALGRARVVSLVGVGGVGKTRLALQVALELSASYPEGVWFCDLAPVIDAQAVPFVVAAAVALPHRPSGDSVESIAVALADHRALIVMDNCEHLVDEVAALVGLLASRCVDVRVLATSREALALDGEEVIPVKPLDGPAGVELFLERARGVGATIGRDAMAAVGEICARLDGLPLAIELAAARSRSMTPTEIAGVLDRRFALLGGTRRRTPDRHQTLKQAIDWSYALLHPQHRDLFDRVGVFAGSFDVAAVMSVARIDELTARADMDALVDRSLIEAEPAGETTRYRLLETLRQYAHDRLADSGLLFAVARRHAVHYAAVAERVRDGIRSPDEAAWVQGIDADLANFRAAIAWSVGAGESDVALRLLVGLLDDSWHRQRYELLSWATDALQIDGALDHELAPSVLSLVARLTSMSGDQHQAIRLADQAIETEERLGLSPSFWPKALLAQFCWYLGRVDEALEHSEAAWAIEARRSWPPTTRSGPSSFMAGRLMSGIRRPPGVSLRKRLPWRVGYVCPPFSPGASISGVPSGVVVILKRPSPTFASA